MVDERSFKSELSQDRPISQTDSSLEGVRKHPTMNDVRKTGTADVSFVQDSEVMMSVQNTDDGNFGRSSMQEILTKRDLEMISESKIYPQKRFFRMLHSKAIPPIPDAQDRGSFPLTRSNILSRTFFWWIVPLISVGYRRTLQPNDLWELSEDLRVETLYQRFCHYMDQYFLQARTRYAAEHPDASEKEIMNNAKLGKYDLVKALLWTFKFRYSLAILHANLSCIVGALLTILVKNLINSVKPPTGINISNSNHSVAHGIGYAIGASVLMLLNTLFFNHFMYESSATGVEAKSVLIKAILQKSIKFSTYARHSWPTGKITSMINTDLSRLEFALIFQPFLLAFPPVFIICLVLLLVNLGAVALLGFSVFILVIGFCFLAFINMMKFRVSTNFFTDKRVSLTKEILNGMKMIKFYVWEDAYEASLKEQRSKEVSKLRWILFLRNFLIAIATTVPSLSAMVTFLAMYRINSSNRTPANIFASLSLFQVLSIQIFFIPLALSSGADAYVGLRRIQSLLESEEEAPRSITSRSSAAELDDSNIAIKVVNASFEWPDFQLRDTQVKDETNLQTTSSAEKEAQKEKVDLSKTSFSGFSDLSFEVKKGELLVITGAIGTGKTSLLNALAGFMHKTNGDIQYNGRMLFCGAPWIQNATIRDNITFGSPYDENLYREVMRVCSLDRDMSVLPAGDKTEVGERGITLSGGQKARINLARCVYKVRDIYLFDDILSAVDARVGASIMNDCLLGKLGDKTRILATHQISLTEQASRVIYLGTDGSFDIGTVDELKTRNVQFANLMKLASQTESESKDDNISSEKFDREDQLRQLQQLDDLTALRKHATTRSTFAESIQGEVSGRLASQEERAVNSLSFTIYKQYIRAACGNWLILILPMIIFLFIITTFLSLFNSVWLSFWAEYKFRGRSDTFYMGMYFFFVMANYLSTNIQFSLVSYLGLRASKNINLQSLHRLLHVPVSFIDTTPLGRILNRFTKDTDILDNELTESLRMFSYQFTVIWGVIIMSIIYLPWFAVAVPLLVVVFILVSDHYQCSAREIKRLEAVQRSFVLNNFNEVISGVDTIKAYHAEARFLKKSDILIDRMNEMTFPLYASQRWVSILIGMIAVLFALIISILCVTGWFNISPASTGVLLTYVLQLPNLFNTLLRAMTQLENDMNSAERVLSYANSLPKEAPYRIPEMAPPKAWPERGAITFDNVALAYRPGLPLVLQDVSFHISSGEKIGICGRTGAGKSTITNALYRLVELSNGSVTIDGVDIATIGLYNLRSKLSIIPQDPLLFRGTIRKNLDPFGEHSDTELWDALLRSGAINNDDLARAQGFETVSAATAATKATDTVATKTGLPVSMPSHAENAASVAPAASTSSAVDATTTTSNDTVSSLNNHNATTSDATATSKPVSDGNTKNMHKFHLDQTVEEDGSNFSVGERQFLALARALVRQTKILILDEATSSVDYETDAQIQARIVQEFQHATIMCVAHRLKTILHYDRILVMEKGRVAEFDTPLRLYNEQGSIFRSMCDQSSITLTDFDA
ncbi:ATP-binding cassette transporter YOR1 Ecym_5660 [Eremothecium cymbalariae DBVPG|uniref:Oligomycin resistance ATP-dependent permease YOR1 n=1 Tax=Eremothecium cymbalariae (strain CBS 270.75 / DBVPG 7215 / KCTC 17166 / NRRL Y-17582) TaxID=931890 RepID=I6NEA1_ERECY|nr:hypothetical protein Ecym_5660 [Eremothecium cymbalariae DBVPG\